MSLPPARQRVWLGVVVGLYLALFARAVTYEYVWDDVAEIQRSELLDGPLLAGLSATQTERNDASLTELVGARLAYDSYRPLLFASYWVEVQLWGRSAAAMHATNIVLGLGAIVCVFALARRVLRDPLLALVATAIFALHPAQIEAVAYISGRGDLLAGVWATASALAVCRALDSSRPAAWTALAAILFAASLFSKESCLGLPLASAALLWAHRQLRARWWIAAALAVVAVGYLLVRRVMTVPTTSAALVDGVVAFPGVCLEYVRIVLLPFDLSTERLHDAAYVLPGWCVGIAVAIALVLAARSGHEPWRAITAGIVWFVVLLAPAAVAIASSSGVVADRYLYAPLPGLSIALVALAARAARTRRWARHALVGLGIAWGVLLGIVAWQQVPVWRANQTLYAHAVAMTPESSEAHYRLAYLAAIENDWDRAIPLLERAVELDPKNVRALVNLGVGLLRTERAADAEVMFGRAVDANPAAFRAWFNLGVARIALGKRAEGCAAIDRALAINPRYELAARTRQRDCRSF